MRIRSYCVFLPTFIHGKYCREFSFCFTGFKFPLVKLITVFAMRWITVLLNSLMNFVESLRPDTPGYSRHLYDLRGASTGEL